VTYLVEKTDPSDRYGFPPETRQCEDFVSLKANWEDLAERGPFEAHEEAGQLVRGEVESLSHTDPESRAEVTARRA
jgi:hypothetical protein